MSRIKGTKSSAALIVSVVALVAALGGGAVAGVAVTSLNKDDKKVVKRIAQQQGKKQANRQIKRREPRLNVNSAQSATTAQSAATAESAKEADSLKGFDPSSVLQGDGVYEATTGSIDVEANFGARFAPVTNVGPLEVTGVCIRTDNEVGGQVGNLGTDPVLVWVQDLAAATPKADDAELDQFDGLASETDPLSRIVSWVGSTGGREFSVDLAMRIVQNGDGTATCDYEVRAFLGS